MRAAQHSHRVHMSVNIFSPSFPDILLFALEFLSLEEYITFCVLLIFYYHDYTMFFYFFFLALSSPPVGTMAVNGARTAHSHTEKKRGSSTCTVLSSMGAAVATNL
jgi:hypothetical protein